MADTNQNLVSFRLTGTLSISGTTVNVSNDILRNTAISIEDASITLTNESKTSFELVVGTIAAGVLTLSKRGVKQDQTLTEDATLKKEWRPGTIGYVTLFASDTLDIDVAGGTATIKNDITFTGDNTFDGGVEFNGTTNLPTFADTTARDTVYTAPVSGDKCIIIGTGEQYYDGGTWNTLGVGSPTPFSSTTVAGTLETATSAESIAGTDTGGTGALLSVLPSDIAKNEQSNTFKYAVDAEASDTYVIALTPALTAYTAGQKITFRPNTANTGACTINVNGLGAKSIKLIDGTDPLDSDLSTGVDYDLIYDGTNFVLQQTPVRATESDITTGTNTLKYVVPSQMPKRAFLQTTRLSDAASGTVTIAHGLGKAPKYIQISSVTTISTSLIQQSDGYSDGGSNNTCTYIITSSGSFSSGTSGTYCIIFQENDATHYTQTATATFDATNVSLVWTRAGGAGTQKTAAINILAVA